MELQFYISFSLLAINVASKSFMQHLLKLLILFAPKHLPIRFAVSAFGRFSSFLLHHVLYLTIDLSAGQDLFTVRGRFHGRANFFAHVVALGRGRSRHVHLVRLLVLGPEDEKRRLSGTKRVRLPRHASSPCGVVVTTGVPSLAVRAEGSVASFARCERQSSSVAEARRRLPHGRPLPRRGSGGRREVVPAPVQIASRRHGVSADVTPRYRGGGAGGYFVSLAGKNPAVVAGGGVSRPGSVATSGRGGARSLLLLFSLLGETRRRSPAAAADVVLSVARFFYERHDRFRFRFDGVITNQEPTAAAKPSCRNG